MTASPLPDFETCYRAHASRDARFDGRIYAAVTSTGIYCRPICPARTPLRQNVRFYAHPAAAELAGFRACKRCRPELSPQSPEWDVRGELVGRALRLVADGVVDREGVAGLARRMAVSERHLRRLFDDTVGAAPLAVARTRRLGLARQLLDQSGLSMAQVAFAAGYTSLRRFNADVRAAYGGAPSELRARARRHTADDPGAGAPELRLRLGYRPPLDLTGLLRFLGGHATPGVEQVEHGRYRRTVAVGNLAGVVTLQPVAGRAEMLLTLKIDDPRAIAPVVQRARQLLDLDADPAAIGVVLGRDPLLAPLVAARPGLRVPGAFDGFEAAVRAILGQQVSVAGANTLAGRLVAACGRPLPSPDGQLTHVFPTPEAVAAADLGAVGLIRQRAAALRALATAVIDGALALDGTAPVGQTMEALRSLPGVGEWTASYVALRALRDPDAFPGTDLGLRRALERLGAPAGGAAVQAQAAAWRPWRAYALMHLWSTLEGR